MIQRIDITVPHFLSLVTVERGCCPDCPPGKRLGGKTGARAELSVSSSIRMAEALAATFGTRGAPRGGTWMPTSTRP